MKVTICVACLVAGLLVVPLGSSVLEARADAFAQFERPKNPEAKEHFAKGNRLYRLREFEKAVEEYKAAALIEDVPLISYNLAQAYRQSGKFEEAIWFGRAPFRYATRDV